MDKSFWSDKNILVTGATGILGSWLTQYLVEQDSNVVILLRDIVPKSHLILSETIKKASISRGELENYRDIERTLNEYEIDTCFHLGAQTIVTTANRSPLSTFESNIRGTWNVLEAVRNSRLVERLVVASSDKAYGEQKELPYTEETPLHGSNPYDVSKVCTDLIAQTYYKTYKIPVSIARLGNIYGGGDLNFNRIVPCTIRSLLHNQRPVVRSDGTLVRDYLYVKDAVKAYLVLCQKLKSKNIMGHAFNFGSGKHLSVMEMVSKIANLIGKTEIKPRILNIAKGEIKRQWLNCQKANKILGWNVKYNLEDGLLETIKWYKSFFKL